MVLVIKKEDILAKLGKKDSLDILDVIVKNYRRYIVDGDYSDMILKTIAEYLFGYPDVELLKRVHRNYTINNNILYIKYLLDKMLDDLAMDHEDVADIVYSSETEDSYHFTTCETK